MNEIDRCERCGGAGTRERHGWVDRQTGLLGSNISEPCHDCHGRGQLDPVASLARAITRRNTLAWCVAHAPDGDDPLRGMYRDAPEKSVLALIKLVPVAAARLQESNVGALSVGPVRMQLEYAAPTLAEVLDAAQRRRVS